MLIIYSYSDRTARGHSQKLFKPYARTNMSKHFFNHQVVDKWNNLPEEPVTNPSLPAFKKIMRSMP